MVNNKKLTKEEELLLQDFSRNVSKKSSALFYFNSFIVSVIPLWLFYRIHEMDLYSSGIMFVVMTCLSTYWIGQAYKNVKFQLKHKIVLRREAAVSKEVNQELDSKQETKKLSRTQKDERILWRKNNVADTEATCFSIFYNNAFYLFILLMFSFYVLRTVNPSVYPFNIGA